MKIPQMAGPTTRSWWVYMLRCGAEGHLYVGRTTDPERRYAQHRRGAGARYTRANRPVALAWVEAGHTASSSGTREAELKRWRRSRKLALIAGRA